MLDGQFSEIAIMLRDAAEDLLAFTGFPIAHWRKIWWTNPLDKRYLRYEKQLPGHQSLDASSSPTTQSCMAAAVGQPHSAARAALCSATRCDSSKSAP